MSYGKNDVINAATKLGRLVNGGVIGYYAGGKTSELMRETIPEQLIDVVERHKKIQLGASIAQSFVPWAGVAASAALVASLWKMYYDINQVLGIKISENAGKSLTSAIITNLSSAAAQGVATTISEGVKWIPGVGWLASAGIASVTSTAIVYGSAFLYMNALSAMYNAKGGFDLDYLSSEISGDITISTPQSTSASRSFNSTPSSQRNATAAVKPATDAAPAKPAKEWKPIDINYNAPIMPSQQILLAGPKDISNPAPAGKEVIFESKRTNAPLPPSQLILLGLK